MSGWKGNLTFGNGTAKGAGLSGFHQSGGFGTFTGLLFRGDSRSPTKMFGTGLFKSGFQMQKAGVSVAGRTTSAVAEVNCDHGTTRGVVSASKKVTIGCYWAISAAQAAHEAFGWVYAIYIENEKMAADAVWNLTGEQGEDAATVQAEIMLKEIPGSCIYGARKAAKAGTVGSMVNSLIGPVVRNTDYTGSNFAGLGAAAADANWTLFSNATDPIACHD